MTFSGQQVMLDTGFLVALNDLQDRHHAVARDWLRRFSGSFVTTPQVITEVAFFLTVVNRAALIDQIAMGWITLVNPDALAYQRMSSLLHKYAECDPDLADISLVWLAEQSGLRSIVTIDINDFSTYRINGRTRFDLVGWTKQPS